MLQYGPDNCSSSDGREMSDPERVCLVKECKVVGGHKPVVAVSKKCLRCCYVDPRNVREDRPHASVVVGMRSAVEDTAARRKRRSGQMRSKAGRLMKL